MTQRFSLPPEASDSCYSFYTDGKDGFYVSDL